MPNKKKTPKNINKNKNTQSINININTQKPRQGPRLGNQRSFTKGNSYLGNKSPNLPFSSTTVVNNIPPINFPSDTFNRMNQFENLANNIITDIQSIKEKINKPHKEEIKQMIPNLPKETRDVLKQSKNYREIGVNTEPMKNTIGVNTTETQTSINNSPIGSIMSEESVSEYETDHEDMTNNRFWQDNPLSEDNTEVPLPVYQPDNTEVPLTINQTQPDSPTNSINQPMVRPRRIITDIPRITLPTDLNEVNEAVNPNVLLLTPKEREGEIVLFDNRTTQNTPRSSDSGPSNLVKEEKDDEPSGQRKYPVQDVDDVKRFYVEYKRLQKEYKTLAKEGKNNDKSLLSLREIYYRLMGNESRRGAPPMFKKIQKELNKYFKYYND